MYVPGDSEAKIAKISSLSADAYILDLEDAVALASKSRAREQVRAALGEMGERENLWVRVNAQATGLLMADLDAVIRPGLAGIVVPKIETELEVRILDWLLTQFEVAGGLAPGSTPIMPIIETALGVTNLREIAEASSRIYCLAFGSGDYGLDLGVDWSISPEAVTAHLVAAKAALIRVSRAAGLLPPHDSVYVQLGDPDGLRRESELASNLGFGGKHAIHPEQIRVIQESFRPTEAQIKWARQVVERFEESEAGGVAALRVDGLFVDYPIAAKARRILEIAEAGNGGL